MNASRNVAPKLMQRVLPSNANGGVRHERSLHAIRSDSRETSPSSPTSPPSSSSSNSQARPFFVATSSLSSSSSAIGGGGMGGQSHPPLFESTPPCGWDNPSAMAIHRLLSNIGAPTSLRNIECMIREERRKIKDRGRGGGGDPALTAEEMIDLIAQIRSIST